MAGSSERPLVLVADDDQHILELVRFALEQEGCEVLAAPDGAEALQLACDRLPQDVRARRDDAQPRRLRGRPQARRGRGDRTTSRSILLLTAKDRDEVAAERILGRRRGVPAEAVQPRRAAGARPRRARGRLAGPASARAARLARSTLRLTPSSVRLRSHRRSTIRLGDPARAQPCAETRGMSDGYAEFTVFLQIGAGARRPLHRPGRR